MQVCFKAGLTACIDQCYCISVRHNYKLEQQNVVKQTQKTHAETSHIGKFGNILAISVMTAMVNKMSANTTRTYIYENFYANPNFHTNRIFGPKVILINNFLCTTSASVSIVWSIGKAIPYASGKGVWRKECLQMNEFRACKRILSLGTEKNSPLLDVPLHSQRSRLTFYGRQFVPRMR